MGERRVNTNAKPDSGSLSAHFSAHLHLDKYNNHHTDVYSISTVGMQVAEPRKHYHKWCRGSISSGNVYDTTVHTLPVGLIAALSGHVPA